MGGRGRRGECAGRAAVAGRAGARAPGGPQWPAGRSRSRGSPFVAPAGPQGPVAGGRPQQQSMKFIVLRSQALGVADGCFIERNTRHSQLRWLPVPLSRRPKGPQP
jgi:hypothetical protein